MAVFIPLVITFIVVDYRSIFNLVKGMFTPFKEMNRRIFGFTTLFLIIQLVFNAMIVFFLVLIKSDLLDFSNYTHESTFLIWVVGCGFSLVNMILNASIGWKWTKSDLELPNGLNWVLGYIFYLIAVGIAVIFVQTVNPSTKGILLWPYDKLLVLASVF
jgi:hypothetical protein